jgi:thioredoxin 1
MMQSRLQRDDEGMREGRCVMTEILRLEPCLGSSHAEFAEIALSGDGDCLVLFDSAWRRPRQRAEEQTAHIAARYGLPVLSVAVEDCPDLAHRYAVAGVPSLLLFRNGQLAARRIGELGERDLEDWIETLLAGT